MTREAEAFEAMKTAARDTRRAIELRSIQAACEHHWSDPEVGLITHQRQRHCEKCGAVQHSLEYTGNDWLDGPMLSVEEYRQRADVIARKLRAVREDIAAQSGK